MVYYPIFVNLKGRPCLVVGGGEVALRKASALIACGARVTVVSPKLGSGLRQLWLKRKILWRRRPFRGKDLDSPALVVAATDDQAVNLQVSRLCRRQGIFVNVVDQPKLCSFIVPSVVRRGKLTLAISTGGVSPALSKWIRKGLQSRYGKEWSRLLAGMAAARPAVLARVKGVARRKTVFEKALAAYFKALGESP